MQGKNIYIILKKELRGYFNNPTAYIVLIVFLLLWEFLFFRNAFLIGEASLRALFFLVPWLFLLLIPALTMGSVAQEKNEGTLEVLLSHPLRDFELVLGKFFGTFIFIFIVHLFLLPLAFSFNAYGDLDWGMFWGQILSSLLLAGVLIALGIFVSAIFKSQISAMLVIAVASFLLLIMGFDLVTASLPSGLATALERLSPLAHFQAMARGVLDLRDLFYYISIIAVFLSLAYLYFLKRRMGAKRLQFRRTLFIISGSIIAIALLNYFGNYFPGRLDLTEDQLYTLTPATRALLSGLEKPVTLTLYASRELPAQARPQLTEIKDILQDYRIFGKGKIQITAKDPSQDEAIKKEAVAAGIQEIRFNVIGNEELQVKNGFLGLVIAAEDQKEVIPFLQDISDLEYQLTSLINKVSNPRKEKIAFLTGHGEKDLALDLRLLNNELSKQFTVESLSIGETQTALASDISVLAVAGPMQEINPREREVIREFINRGGAAFFLIDAIGVSPQLLAAMPNPNSFQDFLNDYGVTVNQDVVYDLRANETINFSGGAMNFLLPYPFWARLQAQDSASRLTAKLESIVMPWASSLGLDEGVLAANNLHVAKIFATTQSGGTLPGDSSLAPDQQFPQTNLGEKITVVSLQKKNGGGRMLILGDADFLTDAFVLNSPSNLAFGLNAFSWLSQEEFLGSIQAKQRVARKLTFESPQAIQKVKFGNLAFVVLAPLAFGTLTLWRRKRLKRFSYGTRF